MSIEIMVLVWEYSKHKGGDLLTMLAIADYANDEGYAWPSVDSLAKKTRTTQRHIPRVFSRLQHSNELSILPQQGPHGTNRYQIHLEHLTPDNLSPPTKCPPDEMPAPLTKCPPDEMSALTTDILPSIFDNPPVDTSPGDTANEEPHPRQIVTLTNCPPDNQGPQMSGDPSGTKRREEKRGSPLIVPPVGGCSHVDHPTSGKPHKRKTAKKEESAEVREVREHLVAATGTKYRTAPFVQTLLDTTDATVSECLLVIDWWRDHKTVRDPNQLDHFGNETPFRPTKFDGYRAKAEKWHADGRPAATLSGVQASQSGPVPELNGKWSPRGQQTLQNMANILKRDAAKRDAAQTDTLEI